MKISIRHTLTFSLGTPARAVQHLLMTAQPTPQQRIEHWSIKMPGIEGASTFRDGFGNIAQLVSQIKPEAEITVIVGGTVETIDKAGVLGRLPYDPMPAMFRRPTLEAAFDPELIEGLTKSTDRIATLHELMGRVNARLATPRQMQTQGEQGQGQGAGATARDHALALAGASRALGLPTRYVTGYLIDDSGQPSVHAWAEAFDDGLGWIGFDAMLDVCPAENHIRLACGLDATGTMPIRSVPGWLEAPVETVEAD